MNKILRKLILCVFALSVGVSAVIKGQEKREMVKYTPDFRFTDGIYLNFDQVKTNSPIPKAKILTSTDYNDKDFFKNLLSGKKIYFYDGMGIRQEVETNSIWGYARNGVLNIQVQGNFNRITFVGNICHFVADVTSYDNRYYGSPYGYYSSPYRTNAARSEIRQYLLDFDSGKILEYDVENTELLLMKDNQLYEEYVQLSRKKKKDLMFVYIRKFNERNPLYIPENSPVL
jgi:hypothetical protein